MISFNSRRREVEALVLKQGLEAITAGVNLVRANTLKRLSGSRSGRTYRVPGTRVTYVASAPGESPAQRTGRLRQSIETDVRADATGIVGTVGTRLRDYPLALEFGTRKTSPRPFLLPAFEEARADVERLMRGKNGS